MIDNQVIVQSGSVTTEGDELYYEVRGHGHPLLMIAPAGGDGWQYSFVADILAAEYKVILYDRRANARSTMNSPQNFEISQQSRDAVAVLHAVGETSAFVFGNSSGAVIALDMAKNHSASVRGVVVHEAPIPRMLPNANKWLRFFASVNLTAFRYGSTFAALQFMLGAKLPVTQLIKATKDINLHRVQSSKPYLSSKDATDVLTKLELLPVTNYLPDIELLKRNEVKVIIGASEWALSKSIWYAQAAQILSEKLCCELIVFPGHHGSFMDMPVAWAEALRNVLHKLQ